LAPQMGIEPT